VETGVAHILEGQFELLLANPTQVQALPGRKTDLKDDERIADFPHHGLLPGSFVTVTADSTAAGSDAEPDHAEAGTGTDREPDSEGVRGRQPETEQRDVGRDGGFRPRDATGHSGRGMRSGGFGTVGSQTPARKNPSPPAGGKGNSERTPPVPDRAVAGVMGRTGVTNPEVRGTHRGANPPFRGSGRDVDKPSGNGSDHRLDDSGGNGP